MTFPLNRIDEGSNPARNLDRIPFRLRYDGGQDEVLLQCSLALAVDVSDGRTYLIVGIRPNVFEQKIDNSTFTLQHAQETKRNTRGLGSLR